MSPFQRAPAELTKVAQLQRQRSMPDPVSVTDASDRLDVQFNVPFTHRVRFTDDVCGKDADVLLDVLDGEGAGSVKVLILCETAVRFASNSVDSLVRAIESRDNIDLVSPLLDLQGGEGIKQDSHSVEHVLRLINEHHMDRRSYVIAIGGGAFLDAVGYAAAIAHRGVRLIRLPTTTLAQGDSGVGVKNAINYFGKKNWIGTFAVPWAVINDAKLLETLPDHEFRCGFAEAVKVTALKDARMFRWLVDNAEGIASREKDICVQAIKNSCIMHLNHIAFGGDAFEALEARPLDFGHWSAHRLEAMSGYSVTHGEAVAIGVALDSLYSHIAFGFDKQEALLVCNTLQRLQLPIWHKLLESHESLLQGLEEFREHLGGRLTVTMLQAIGHPIDVHSIDRHTMVQALNWLKEIAVAGPGNSL